MKKLILGVCVLFTLTSCSTVARHFRCKSMLNLSMGMTRLEVIEVMGSPRGIRAINETQYLMYSTCANKYGVYFIRLKNGVVDSYGEKGDFDSTKIPTSKTIIEIR